jgi:hypothetical protein
MKRILRHLAVLAALVALVLSGAGESHAAGASAAEDPAAAAQMHHPNEAPGSHSQGAAAQDCAPAAMHCGGSGAILTTSCAGLTPMVFTRLRLALPAEAGARGLPAEAETPPPRA